MNKKFKEAWLLVFTFEKNDLFQLPWHVCADDGIDIRLSILALPAIIWMLILGIDKYLIGLVLLSACSCYIRFNRKPKKPFIWM